MKWDAFIGGTHEAQSPLADCERTVNYYRATMQSEGATAQRILAPAPGVRTLSQALVGPGRAHYVIGGREFAVIGIRFYEIDVHGVMTEYSLGTVARGMPPFPGPDTDPVTMCGGGDLTNQVLVTVGSNAYYLDLTYKTLTKITALNGLASCGAYLEGYFLVLDAATSTLYISELANGSTAPTWTVGTDRAQRSLAPDPWWMLKTAGRLAWLWGEQTTEIWQNVGSQSLPFAPHPSGLLQLGILAPWSAAVSGNDVYWLARTPGGRMCVMTASGFQPSVISTKALEMKIEDYRYPEEAVGEVYSEDGHTFYSLSFDRDNATWVWDTAEQQWHERGTWDETTGQFNVWRPRYHALAFNQHRTLDSASGNLYHLSAEYLTDVDGSNMRRLRRAPAIWKEGKRVFYPGLELGMDVGMSQNADKSAMTHIVLRVSNDGGHTWVAELPATTGPEGAYNARVRWNRLGSARRRVFEVVVTHAGGVARNRRAGAIVEASFNPEPEVEQ